MLREILVKNVVNHTAFASANVDDIPGSSNFTPVLASVKSKSLGSRIWTLVSIPLIVGNERSRLTVSVSVPGLFVLSFNFLLFSLSNTRTFHSVHPFIPPIRYLALSKFHV